jgi:hypothetical protein
LVGFGAYGEANPRNAMDGVVCCAMGYGLWGLGRVGGGNRWDGVFMQVDRTGCWSDELRFGVGSLLATLGGGIRG